jgi:hypothetical protein
VTEIDKLGSQSTDCLASNSSFLESPFEISLAVRNVGKHTVYKIQEKE